MVQKTTYIFKYMGSQRIVYDNISRQLFASVWFKFIFLPENGGIQLKKDVPICLFKPKFDVDYEL